MAISALTITSSKELGEIAIGEPIDYSITITGTIGAGEKIAVSIRNSDDDSEAYSTRFTHPAASPVTGTISKTWGLKTSRGRLLFTGVADGSYYLHVETEDTLIEGDSETFDIVLLTPWMLKNVYMAGLPFVDKTGVALDDALITTMVELAIGDIEEDTQIFFYPKTVRTEPSADEIGTYDLAKDRLTYIWRDMRLIPFLNLPSYMVQSIEWLRGYQGNLVIDIPSSWLKLSVKRGTVQIVANTTALMGYVGTSGWFIFLGALTADIANFWDVKYTAGWDESKEDFPRNFLYLIGIGTSLKIAPILSDALKRGISSESLSMDGVSESQSVSGKILLEGRIERYTTEYQDHIKRIKNKYRGPTLTVA